MNDSVIVITGSTRGIGYGLADAFLANGRRVVITGRNPAEATQQLSAKHSAERVESVICDVRKRDDVETLWNDAVKRFGRVDVWINNAGALTTHVPFLQQSAASVEDVVVTNLLGTVVGTHVAVTRMAAQGSGRIFNVGGFGADGRMMRTGLAVYGSTKCGVRYFNCSTSSVIRSTSRRRGWSSASALGRKRRIDLTPDAAGDPRAIPVRRRDAHATCSPRCHLQKSLVEFADKVLKEIYEASTELRALR